MPPFVSRGPLYEEAGEGTGAGAGTGDGKSGAAFDSAAFETKLMGEFDKKLNGALKTQKTDFQKAVKELKDALALKEPEHKEGEHKDNEHKEGSDGKPDPEKNALQLELKKERETNRTAIQALQKENTEGKERLEKTDRESKLRAELAKHPIAPGAMEVAVLTLLPKVTRSEDKPDDLVAGDLPLAKFLEVTLPAQYPFFLAPKEVGGGGLRKGKDGLQNKKYDLDRKSPNYSLRPEHFNKFSPAEQNEIRQLVATS